MSDAVVPIASLRARLCDLSEKKSVRATDVIPFLEISDHSQRSLLFEFADEIRRKYMGDGIFLRGIVEFSNICGQDCCYCGLRRTNASLARYRMSQEEILEAVREIFSFGIKTVVLQSGEDHGLSASWLADVIREIRDSFDMAVTLSVGERSPQDYAIWKQAGADRYLLKIETTDGSLYQRLRPAADLERRLACLKELKRLGYQTGSGIMVGLPGQTLASLAEDIVFFAREDFDMIGIGPFIPHPQTPLRDGDLGSAPLVLKVLALTRILTKSAHLPATTAMGSLDRDWRAEALKVGANVLMPNFTPLKYRRLYDIYPNKRCLDEPVGVCAACADRIAEPLGRWVDYGRGDRCKIG